MKPDPSNPNDPALSRLLREWKVSDSSLPPRFSERVWQRIGASEKVPRSGLAVAWARLQEFLARPRLAVGYVTALLMLGFVAGWAQGQEKSVRMERDLRARYLQVIDPYQGTTQ